MNVSELYKTCVDEETPPSPQLQPGAGAEEGWLRSGWSGRPSSAVIVAPTAGVKLKVKMGVQATPVERPAAQGWTHGLRSN